MQNENMIPKQRFDEINDEKKRLEQEIAPLREAAAEVEKLRADLEKTRIINVTNKLLYESGAINPETVKPLLKLPEKNEESDINALKGQIEALKINTDTAFLFRSTLKSGLKGILPDEGCDEIPERRINGLDAAIAKHLTI